MPDTVFKSFKQYLYYIGDQRRLYITKETRDISKFSWEIKLLICKNCLTYGLDMIFTKNIFLYQDYFNTILEGEIHMDYIYEFDPLDRWLIYGKGVIGQYIKRNLYSILDNSDRWFRLRYDAIKHISDQYGQDFIATYLRNYYVFKLNTKDRLNFEKIIKIPFLEDKPLKETFMAINNKKEKDAMVVYFLKHHKVNLYKIFK